MDTINIATFAVRDNAGNIDLDATMEKFTATLADWNSTNANLLADVRKAISDVFDANPGKTLPSNFILAQVTAALNLTEEKEFKLTEARVHEVLALAPYSKTVGAKGGVKRNEEASVAPVVNSESPPKKKQGGKKVKQGKASAQA